MKFFNRIRKYIMEVISELKRVSWVKRKELIGTTVVVIILSLILAIYIGIFDFIFSRILHLVIR
ncbi:MAG: preprotein translocase subunit SecE [candidate division WOR-3 bacterium]|nr:preprotein translocase subunit SecE [candidate division WOR-3 bacterium]MDH5683137.1 preprotein translocase subunit SecE [candidate division WOR-3 bacterium]